MFVEGKKYYLVTYYNVFFEVRFIRTQQYAAQSNLTEYVFRTKRGDIHLSGCFKQSVKNNNFISPNFDEAKIEIARRIYQGKNVNRLPEPQSNLLSWAIKKHPEKLL